MMDNRIGTIDKDGRKVYPSLNVAGHTYDRTSATTVGINKSQFVVLAFDGNDQKNIESVKASIAKPTRTKGVASDEETNKSSKDTE